jgi:xanthine dehydrogenase accessory factor
MTQLTTLKILIRGAGEMATGVACRLYRSGFRRILLTEIPQPLAVRRSVSLCEAIIHGSHRVEGVYAIRIDHAGAASEMWGKSAIPIIIDPKNIARNEFGPDILIDAVMAKRNTGVSISDAPLVIALGPGFSAGADAHCVIETNRGHDLGRLLYDGPASPDTGIPGPIGGHTSDRVLRAPCDGLFESDHSIGDIVQSGQQIGTVSKKPVASKLNGTLRGLICPGVAVTQGLKIGDVDPRGIVSYCYTISEKARALGGSVLEAVLAHYNK